MRVTTNAAKQIMRKGESEGEGESWIRKVRLVSWNVARLYRARCSSVCTVSLLSVTCENDRVKS